MDTKVAGRMGGQRRAQKMTAEERSKSAKKAANARWRKKDRPTDKPKRVKS